MKGEWSAENLLFWEAVQRLHMETDPEKLRLDARKIYDKYFKTNSIHQLNLPHVSQASIDTLMQRALSDSSLYTPSIFSFSTCLLHQRCLIIFNPWYLFTCSRVPSFGLKHG